MGSILRDGIRNTNLVFNKIKRTLHNHKAKARPKVPESIQKLHDTFLEPAVLENYGYNLDGDELFYIDTVVAKDYAFTVFASQFVIDFVQSNIAPRARKYLMDGTFDSLPKDFYQLLIITVEYQNDVSRSFKILCIHPSARPPVRCYRVKKPIFMFY